MANICDNELKLIAYNDEAITVINEIRNKIKEKSEESFYSYLCPDSKLWGTDERDFKFVNVSILHSSKKEIHLHLATRWSPPVGAVEEFQTRMDAKEIDLSISLTYIEPGCDFIGFYLDGDSELRTYFEAASRNLFDDTTSTGGYGTPDDTNFIQLSQLDKQLEPISVYKLIGASIRNINDIGYSMATGTGQTMELDVTIAYHYYIDPRRLQP